MNREVKFRAWHKGDGNRYILDIRDIAVLGIDGVDNIDMFENFCQYTGLKDKDGKEIYEGDIVKFKAIIHGNKIAEGIVSYHPITAGFIIDRGDNGCYYFNVQISDLEIIGNIYENPELLTR